MGMHCLPLTLVATSALLGISASLAAEYPEQSLSLMVPYAAGGATDYQARIVTMPSTDEQYLGQPMIIVNKPGAGGRIGWNWFATDAMADGHELATYNIPHFLAQSLEGGVEYDLNSFEPIANWGADPAVVVVADDSEYQSIEQLLEFAREHPGRATFSGAGLYVGHHIAALQIEKDLGSELAYIATKGGGVAAMEAVVAGDVMAGINNLSDAYRAREQGKVRILAVADTKRNEELLPDVPTLQEAGYDIDDTSVNYRGIMVPAGTPDAIIDTLAARVPAMFSDAQVISLMDQGGAPMQVMTREQVKAMWVKRREILKSLLLKLRH